MLEKALTKGMKSWYEKCIGREKVAQKYSKDEGKMFTLSRNIELISQSFQPLHHKTTCIG